MAIGVWTLALTLRVVMGVKSCMHLCILLLTQGRGVQISDPTAEGR